jgi:hypothetical protein
MRALQELRRGPAATVAIGKADQVNLAQQQVNNSGCNTTNELKAHRHLEP